LILTSVIEGVSTTSIVRFAQAKCDFDTQERNFHTHEWDFTPTSEITIIKSDLILTSVI
jgi:hypothetical protein